ncbi:helix-turn-helix transcriptional regulator [filamentous cyanobacterium LEGE 11480]|uniref:Helix-turn-helix transcriptional regulator n=1 Tax=Romeriopsis navalis LEGE 11480 TaxID=2777977 RepID=A0A928VUV2_9CYAN|nr:helix-turn-helix transcriptional regulator [Romeriopsis navalis]MBE9032947.1 helix-turn-helix transcriptional regulator [Romeriopsis navalis LEGE 11480]
MNVSNYNTNSSGKYVLPEANQPDPSSLQLGCSQLVTLLNAMRSGVLVVTDDMRLIYRNQTVTKIFEALNIHAPNGMPQALINYCNQFLQETDEWETEPLIIDCQPCPSRLLRWHISWFPEHLPEADGQRCMLVVLENCYGDLLIQMHRDQKRYDLTDRESQIWVMLKFGMAYQDIADNFSITINTVKSHARNIYNKQRDHKPQAPRLWFLGDDQICGTN